MAAETSSTPNPIDEPKGDESRGAGSEDVRRHRRELQNRLAAAQDHWRRTAADLDNLRKRFDREVARERLHEREAVLTAMVSLLDDLERAVETARVSGLAPPTDTVEARTSDFATDGGVGAGDLGSFVVGVESIVRRMKTTVSTFGYDRFGEPGDTFDPTRHEVIGTVASAGPDRGGRGPSIVAVAKPGYGSPERLLRPAAVIVAVEAG